MASEVHSPSHANLMLLLEFVIKTCMKLEGRAIKSISRRNLIKLILILYYDKH